MSSVKRQFIDRNGFAVRFAEACGTSSVVEIQQVLGIRYQTARNYLGGRVPDPEMLVHISEKTSYSIDWLLTGRGAKLIAEELETNTPISARQVDTLVRRICTEVFGETGETVGHRKVVTLKSAELLNEKAVEESSAYTRDKR